MRRTIFFLLAGMLIGSGAALGKLPPPTPEEQAAAAAKKAAEAEELEKAKGQLEKAQDRIVTRYRKERPAGSSSERTPDHNMPKTTSERPGGTGPDPVRPQSAEAHSAPAK